jgi:hypothetical protein
MPSVSQSLGVIPISNPNLVDLLSLSSGEACVEMWRTGFVLIGFEFIHLLIMINLFALPQEAHTPICEGYKEHDIT